MYSICLQVSRLQDLGNCSDRRGCSTRAVCDRNSLPDSITRTSACDCNASASNGSRSRGVDCTSRSRSRGTSNCNWFVGEVASKWGTINDGPQGCDTSSQLSDRVKLELTGAVTGKGALPGYDRSYFIGLLVAHKRAVTVDGFDSAGGTNSDKLHS